MSIKKKQLYQTETLIELMNAVLPSGFIGWFKRTTAPKGWAICDGRSVTLSDGTTTQTPNLIGRYILGATSEIGSQVAPGLPNITGTIATEAAMQQWKDCFEGYKTGDDGGYWGASTHEPKAKIDGIRFDASRSNSIYGNSKTVTPPSTKLLPCMKL